MKTLVERLRIKASKGGVIPIGDMTILEAATEIERLRAALTEVCAAGDTDWSAKKMYWAARNALNGPEQRS